MPDRSCTIFLNGTQHVIYENTTLAEVLRNLSINSPNFAVAVNKEFVPRNRYGDWPIAANDSIEILTPMVGG